ncbi:MAG: ribosomal protein S18-alanine N-acetyltransferase [Ruminiclostridium sp.]|nr:ribosomal protein S18-alanine N-acetyltransferase [Ruminiclostridium sp.]
MILTDKNCDRSLIIQSVAKVEAACFSDPWTPRALDDLLCASGSVFVCSADNDGNITGYVCGQIAADECELYRIAVSDKYRGKGYAKELMEYFIEECRRNNVRGIFLEVRSSNVPARTLYEKYGFQNIATRKNYYRNPTEDAIIYKYEA